VSGRLSGDIVALVGLELRWKGDFDTTVKRSGESPLGEPPTKKRPALEILPSARAFYVPPILLPEDALQMLMPAFSSAPAGVTGKKNPHFIDY